MENQNLFSNNNNVDDGNTMLPNFGIDFPSCYFNSNNWDNSADQGDPFESALSSMVSSPVPNTPPSSNGDDMVLRELIGRLGSICNSSNNTSCYNTPLNSPPKPSPVGSGRTGGNFQFQIPSDPSSLAGLSVNSEFAERAARYLGARNVQYSEHPSRKLSRGSSLDNGYEGSSVSEKIPSENGRKRKGVVKGKGKEKETTLPSSAKTDPKVTRESDEKSKKRKPNEDGNEKEKKNSKEAEPPKDYIHVRARRGQATDSHSLAERVRREKISARMKFLQDLVPGCNKVIGKAVMLDEIINYVQSLQHQVEFLSMKLATVNMEFNPEALLSKEVFQSLESIQQNMFLSDATFPYGYQSQAPFSIPPLNPEPQQNMSMATTFWGDDLHSVVQNNFEHNQPQNVQNGTGYMKLEL